MDRFPRRSRLNRRDRGDDRSEDGSTSSEDSEDDEVPSGLRYIRSVPEHLNEPERQFIFTIGGGLDFDREEGTELLEVPRRGDGMCLYNSLLKTDDASLADGLRQEINDFIISSSGTILGTTDVQRSLELLLRPSQNRRYLTTVTFRLKLVGRILYLTTPISCANKHPGAGPSRSLFSRACGT